MTIPIFDIYNIYIWIKPNVSFIYIKLLLWVIQDNLMFVT